MTDTKLLEAIISESGLKKKFLAQKLGLSRAGFRNCMTNKSEFTSSQIDILCRTLNITSMKVMKAIFFARIGS